MILLDESIIPTIPEIIPQQYSKKRIDGMSRSS